MGLKDDLTELVQRVPGALGAILVDWEGEAVEHAANMDDYELKVLGAYKGVILSNLRSVLRRCDGDAVEELVIGTSLNQTIIRPITDEYFLVLTCRSGETLLGRALFEARRCARSLYDEIV